MHSNRKALRNQASAKAKRLTSASTGKVDASSWTPESTPVESELQTGMKPISRRAFKRGGKVEGAKAKHHAGKKPRKAGNAPATPVAMANRDMKQANKERPGKELVGALKRGGKVHDDEAEDKKLIKKVVKPSAIKKKSGGEVLRTKKNSDGSQQYVRGSGPMDRIDTLSKYQNKTYGDSEKAFREGDKYESNKLLKGASSLDKAQQEEAKDEIGSRTTPFKKGGRTKRASGGQTVNREGKGDYDGNYPSDMSAEKAEQIRAKQDSDSKREREFEANQPHKRGGKVHAKDCGCKMCSGGRTKKAFGGQMGQPTTPQTMPVPAAPAAAAPATSGAPAGSPYAGHPMYENFMSSHPGIAGAINNNQGLISGILGAYPGVTKLFGGADSPGMKMLGRMSDRRQGRKNGGRTNINIVISPKSDVPAALPPQPMPPNSPPVGMDKPPVPPGGASVPPQIMAALAAKAAAAGGGGPPMIPPRPYKRGGKVYSSAEDMDAGAKGGKGRLEKAEIAARSRGR